MSILATVARIGVLGIMLVLAAVPARAATLPAGFTEALVAAGLASPTAMQIAPDGRIFVCEQGGGLRVIKNGALLPAPFATLNADSAGERGLLGIAFDPNFAINHYLYVYYTTAEPAVRNRISRLTSNGDVVVPNSEVVLFEFAGRSPQNHLGGALNFGPDGKLYVSKGDNGGTTIAQSLTSVHGKILRFNPDGTIPTDNPFYQSTSGENRAIWALGLRNPFTFAFRPHTSQMFINDVGDQSWEEINEGVSGANYGWPDTEGATTDPRFRSPVHAYVNGSAASCAITGGTFYAPAVQQFPADYANDYFFADVCGGWIRKLDPAAGYTFVTFATGIAAPVDLKVDEAGSLYYLARGAGSTTGVVHRIDFDGASTVGITLHPVSQMISSGAPVTFSVRASGAAPLTYQWQRDSVNISGATAQDYTIGAVTAAQSGAQFRAVVTNGQGSAFSNAAVLTVTSNQGPTATITQPAVGTLYSGGNTINVAGTGTDAQDGTLSASAFTWRVDFHHDTHTHPLIPPTSGITAGSFTIPTTGETATNVWYRVYLTVTDSGGQSHTVTRDVLPRVVQLTLATSPAGLQVRLDGQPHTTPYVLTAVVGIVRTIEGVTPQTSGGTAYEFASWSDGGVTSHTVSTPASNTIYTATYTSGGGSGPGSGLPATYFNNSDFTGTSLARIDGAVDFVWSSVPAPGISGDTFSVRWIGQVLPQFSQTYTFFTESDNGVRLWVNGQLLINNWTSHLRTMNSGTISLVGGQRYSIQMEYYDNTGTAIARLGWSSPSTPLAVIPSARLYP